jgi:hypothetical protein
MYFGLIIGNFIGFIFSSALDWENRQYIIDGTYALFANIFMLSLLLFYVTMGVAFRKIKDIYITTQTLASIWVVTVVVLGACTVDISSDKNLIVGFIVLPIFCSLFTGYGYLITTIIDD